MLLVQLVSYPFIKIRFLIISTYYFSFVPLSRPLAAFIVSIWIVPRCSHSVFLYRKPVYDFTYTFLRAILSSSGTNVSFSNSEFIGTSNTLTRFSDWPNPGCLPHIVFSLVLLSYSRVRRPVSLVSYSTLKPTPTLFRPDEYSRVGFFLFHS